MRAPAPRGPLAATLLDELTRPPGPVPHLVTAAREAVAASDGVLADEDVGRSALRGRRRSLPEFD